LRLGAVGEAGIKIVTPCEQMLYEREDSILSLGVDQNNQYVHVTALMFSGKCSQSSGKWALEGRCLGMIG
jgi:hypothetical protein